MQAAQTPEDADPVAERTCIVTRTVREPDDLIRFVRAPDGSVVPDIRCRLPGRGVWVTAERGMVAEAVARRLFSRGLRAEARAAGDLPDQTGALLADAALSLLALANKAGLAVTGFEKTAEAARKGRKPKTL